MFRHICIFATFVALCTATISLDNTRTFGTAIKGGALNGTEQTVFEYTLKGKLGVVNYIWVTGATPNTRIRLYIDGETVPSLDFNFYEGTGIGWSNDTGRPWGNAIMGKNAGHTSYITYRIPFGEKIKITLTYQPPSQNLADLAQPFDPATNHAFWFICRGLDFKTPQPIEWGSGGYTIPPTARLKLYKSAGTLKPLEFTTLYDKPKQDGAVWMVFIQANSSDLNFLEACFRAYIGGATDPMFLSSGTEDFFNSAFYFDRGTFHDPLSGLSNKAKQGPGDQWRLGMYRTFDRDPLVFSDGLKLKWRNFESVGLKNGQCPNRWAGSPDTGVEPKMVGDPEVNVMSYSSYTWVYEW
eukprot:NODE_868_length_1145_cov_111.340864_g826_i0.p1 GENE.NODE_868_length_1145_cov_111.340864_g826_i0~~NODE_868_length_1145_cov_111.340864_g826_i0.p1  ORF type:complete len:354 (+),score=69.83 NODE_868_length_1145_cov_111.340864_g826_i0:55-1116(+)